MGFWMVRGFSSDRKVMLDSDLGSLLSTPPLATHCRWAAIARVAKSEISRWRSLSSKLPAPRPQRLGPQVEMKDGGEKNREQYSRQVFGRWASARADVHICQRTLVVRIGRAGAREDGLPSELTARLRGEDCKYRRLKAVRYKEAS